MKKSLLFAALLGSALLLGACGESDKKDEPKTDEEKKVEETEKNLKIKEPSINRKRRNQTMT